MILMKICMSPRRCLPSPCLNVVDYAGGRGLKGGLPRWCWTSYLGKALVGAAEAAPARNLPGELASSLSSLVSLVSCFLGHLMLRLLSFALLSVAVARGSDCPCTSKGCRRSGNGSPQTCLLAAHGVAMLRTLAAHGFRGGAR